MWQVTVDRWQVTGDRWLVTCDIWHRTHSVGWPFSQNFSSLALPVWDWQCFEYISTNHELMSYLLNYEAVYRTAPATPGLLTSLSLGGCPASHCARSFSQRFVTTAWARGTPPCLQAAWGRVASVGCWPTAAPSARGSTGSDTTRTSASCWLERRQTLGRFMTQRTAQSAGRMKGDQTFGWIETAWPCHVRWGHNKLQWNWAALRCLGWISKV